MIGAKHRNRNQPGQALGFSYHQPLLVLSAPWFCMPLLSTGCTWETIHSHSHAPESNTRGYSQEFNGHDDGLVILELANIQKTDRINLDDGFVKSLNSSQATLPLDADVAPMLNVPVELGDIESAGASASIEANGETNRLLGIYTGQIQARIERVWRRPRTPVSDPENISRIDESFQCEVQIEQDALGNVVEVLLPRCNGTLAWQQSLLSAIRQASPLSAPPSAGVFRSSIALCFLGFPYAKDSSEDEYDTDRVVASARQLLP